MGQRARGRGSAITGGLAVRRVLCVAHHMRRARAAGVSGAAVPSAAGGTGKLAGGGGHSAPAWPARKEEKRPSVGSGGLSLRLKERGAIESTATSQGQSASRGAARLRSTQGGERRAWGHAPHRGQRCRSRRLLSPPPRDRHRTKPQDAEAESGAGPRCARSSLTLPQPLQTIEQRQAAARSPSQKCAKSFGSHTATAARRPTTMGHTSIITSSCDSEALWWASGDHKLLKTKLLVSHVARVGVAVLR